MNDNPPEKTDSYRCDQIKEKISINRQLLQTSEVNAAVGEFPECADAQRQLADTLNAIERKLEDIPPIDIAVLGPSRHGKSTLLNSLAAQDLLPTSDVKPCTASILKMTWSEDWSVRIKFVELEQLKRDWGEAVKDARIEMEERQNAGSENNADPSFIRNTLRRFLTLFKIDDQLPPQEMIEAVRNGKLTGRIVKSIKDGELVLPAADIETMKALIQKYLSTDDVYWTIVAQCEILGPFNNWHPSLTLVDLPGTNDTDPQRTAVTNSVREKCTAVAIVTSDSNLGPDIEAWLRHSSVLSNFLEATKKRRQRLFIVRTKVDSYHPEIDDDVDDISEEEEARQYAAAIEKYKKEQTDSYHTMLQDIAGPKLPNGDDENARAKRAELLSRISEIPVYYVSALAHEVFSGRHRAGKRTRRQLSEYFDDDIQKTGIPQLRDSFVEIAKEYLAENFYDDLEDELESEARHMAAVFRSCSSILKAEIADGRKALTTVVTNVKSELLPWWKSEVSTIGSQFGDQLQFGSDGIMTKLKYASEMSKRRFGDKIQLWSNYHWASLRAATRKNGSHITSRGQSIDFAEDICTVLVDDVLLAWSQFRDDVIENQVSEITNDLVAELNQRLENFKTLTEVPEVHNAITQISNQLYGISNQQRLQLLQMINRKIKEVESIRKPAYDIAHQEMKTMYGLVSEESGTGCARRMAEHLQREAPMAIARATERVHRLINTTVSDLTQSCQTALNDFGFTAATRIDSAVDNVSAQLIERDKHTIKTKIHIADSAIKLLPAPAGA